MLLFQKYFQHSVLFYLEEVQSQIGHSTARACQHFLKLLVNMFFFLQGTRNTGKSIANRNTANPTAMLLASCLLLDHLKLHSYASMIRRAILSTVTETRVSPCIVCLSVWHNKSRKGRGDASIKKTKHISGVSLSQCSTHRVYLCISPHHSPDAHSWPGGAGLHLWSGPVHHEGSSEHGAPDHEHLDSRDRNLLSYTVY